MLYTARNFGGMGEPPMAALQPLTRHFPQWSRTAILTYGGGEDERAIQVTNVPAEPSGSGFVIGGDAVTRVAHLEHSVRFLQEQHRLMLSGLHTEIEALRERNRDLQFQLIFNKESPPKAPSPVNEEDADDSEVAELNLEVTRLEDAVAAARGDARAAEVRALQLQRLVDAQTLKLRELKGKPCACEGKETRAELRDRLLEAERLVRRLRADADRQRRELLCMKSSIHSNIRGPAAVAAFQNNYHFPPVHTSDFWREPAREDHRMMGRVRHPRRPLTLPELSGQHIRRSTVYANPMVTEPRPRANGHDKKKPVNDVPNTPEEPPAMHFLGPIRTNDTLEKTIVDSSNNYPELKIVVTKVIPRELASTPVVTERRPRRHNHRKHASTDHT